MYVVTQTNGIDEQPYYILLSWYETEDEAIGVQKELQRQCEFFKGTCGFGVRHVPRGNYSIMPNPLIPHHD